MCLQQHQTLFKTNSLSLQRGLIFRSFCNFGRVRCECAVHTAGIHWFFFAFSVSRRVPLFLFCCALHIRCSLLFFLGDRRVEVLWFAPDPPLRSTNMNILNKCKLLSLAACSNEKLTKMWILNTTHVHFVSLKSGRVYIHAFSGFCWYLYALLFVSSHTNCNW